MATGSARHGAVSGGHCPGCHTRRSVEQATGEDRGLRLKKGTELVGLEIGTRPHPWMESAGMFADDPAIDQWVRSMAEYRQEVEDDANR